MKRLIIAEEIESTEPNDEHIEKLVDAFADLISSPPYDIKYQLETAYELYIQKVKQLSGIDENEITDDEYKRAYDIARGRKQDFAALMQMMGIGVN